MCVTVSGERQQWFLIPSSVFSWGHLHGDQDQGSGDGGGMGGTVLPDGALQRGLRADRGGDPGTSSLRVQGHHQCYEAGRDQGEGQCVWRCSKGYQFGNFAKQNKDRWPFWSVFEQKCVSLVLTTTSNKNNNKHHPHTSLHTCMHRSI